MLSIQSLCHFDEGVGMDKVLYHIFSWKIANMSAVLKYVPRKVSGYGKIGALSQARVMYKQAKKELLGDGTK